MAEIINVIVAFVVIIFIFRWATSGSNTDRTAADTLGFRPKNVSQEMLDTISNMFPDIPLDNIRYDLLRTGSVELTTNRILERGYLDAPPPSYYQLYSREPTRPRSPANTNNAPVLLKAKENLIERFDLQHLVDANTEPIPDSEIGGRSVWEDTPEKREASLKERKAKMILAARQRMLAAQKNET
ncbi:hypothetical protein E1B28_005957 [Marasmius oreades]|uniref:CUE domain-containing protein n=1 Tax=Marasmius oreades TaxID=181124 RepID=A0A9P7UV37_9AGAR|nr:uncharacterized protein E1B28_005957 [Marasmius oreades]KAG7095178.1 hypothetical protein E1B28_005957 [Marasmius oreades]